MIQPISASCPRAVFRGSSKAYGITGTPKKVSSEVALINAGGVTFAAGGLTTALARSYTSSWSRAGAMGVCGAALAMVFIAPRLVENTNLGRYGKKSEIAGKETGKTNAVIKERLVTPKKLVQFRAETPTA